MCRNVWGILVDEELRGTRWWNIISREERVSPWTFSLRIYCILYKILNTGRGGNGINTDNFTSFVQNKFQVSNWEDIIEQKNVTILIITGDCHRSLSLTRTSQTSRDEIPTRLSTRLSSTTSLKTTRTKFYSGYEEIL